MRSRGLARALYTERAFLKKYWVNDMKTDNKSVGTFGEASACTFLKHKGYKILERNYRNRGGEIDIIARKDDYIVFVEVKTRNSEDFGAPSEAVNVIKQQKIVNTAMSFIMQNGSDSDYRFDVIEVMYKRSVFGGFKTVKVNHIENAFGV